MSGACIPHALNRCILFKAFTRHLLLPFFVRWGKRPTLMSSMMYIVYQLLLPFFFDMESNRSCLDQFISLCYNCFSAAWRRDNAGGCPHQLQTHACQIKPHHSAIAATILSEQECNTHTVAFAMHLLLQFILSRVMQGQCWEPPASLQTHTLIKSAHITLVCCHHSF